MNNLIVKKLLIFLMIFSLTSVLAEAQPPKRIQVPVQSRSAQNRAPKKSAKAKAKGPVSIKNAKKKQEAKEKKDDRDYKKYVKENQKRSIEIQTPEVQDRMKQNMKNANSNYKAKKKNSAARTKKAGKKYK